MKILITGGLGFVGTSLSDYLLEKPGDWQKALGDVDAVVNLAGKSIFKRWSESYKKQIYDSRILTTRNVVEALPADQSVVLCSASGAGYYGNRGDDLLNEDEKSGNDFLASVSVDWEAEALKATAKGIRAALMRFGVILGKGGGALAKMIPAFKAFVGGPIGSGRQWFPWMHLTDLMAAILFVCEQSQVNGPLNFCAPNPVTNRELANTLGEVLGRPTFMPAPAFMVRAVLGEFGNVLLDSQRTIPAKLLSHGFEFRHPDIRSAIQAVVS